VHATESSTKEIVQEDRNRSIETKENRRSRERTLTGEVNSLS
jgi:hypothetical protein